MLEVRTNEFCGISRNQKWQEWLRQIDNDLFIDLKETLQDPNGGCRKNTAKMLEIYNKITKIGKKDELMNFLAREFPSAISEKTAKTIIRRRRLSKSIDRNKYKTLGKPNKHDVFSSYNPRLLSFPQKMIIIDPDINSLKKKVANFVSNKVKADYIIIEDRAYIEFFLPKYKQEAEKFPSHERELYKWRKTNT